MKYKEVVTKVFSNENKLAKRTGWKTDKVVDKNSINSINESDRQADDWVVLERINE